MRRSTSALVGGVGRAAQVFLVEGDRVLRVAELAVALRDVEQERWILDRAIRLLELAQRALVLREVIKLRRGGVVLFRVPRAGLSLAVVAAAGGDGRCGARGAPSERKRQRDDAPSCTRETHDGPQGLRLASALSILRASPAIFCTGGLRCEQR
jgi:hypothetical protein